MLPKLSDSESIFKLSERNGSIKKDNYNWIKEAGWQNLVYTSHLDLTIEVLEQL